MGKRVTISEVQNPRLLEQVIRELQENVEKAERKKEVQVKPDVEGTLTSAMLDQIRAALQYGGSHALNLTNLSGRLAEPQEAQIEKLAALPDVADKANFEGRMVQVGLDLKTFRAGSPGSWETTS